MNLEYAQGRIEKLIASISERLSPENEELLHEAIFDDYVDQIETHLRNFYEKTDEPLYARLTLKLHQGQREWEHYRAEDKLERLEAFLKNNVAIDLENRIQRDRDSIIAGEPYTREEFKHALDERTQERDKLKKQFEECKQSYLELKKEREGCNQELAETKKKADDLSPELHKKVTALSEKIDQIKKEKDELEKENDNLTKAANTLRNSALSDRNQTENRNVKYKFLFYIIIFLFLNALVFLLPPALRFNYNWKNVILLEVGFVTILPVLYVKEIPNYVAIIIGIVLGIVSVFEF